MVIDWFHGGFVLITYNSFTNIIATAHIFGSNQIFIYFTGTSDHSIYRHDGGMLLPADSLDGLTPEQVIGFASLVSLFF